MELNKNTVEHARRVAGISQQMISCIVEGCVMMAGSKAVRSTCVFYGEDRDGERAENDFKVLGSDKKNNQSAAWSARNPLMDGGSGAPFAGCLYSLLCWRRNFSDVGGVAEALVKNLVTRFSMRESSGEEAVCSQAA